jgi:signal transduction histidine kinase
VQADEVVRTCVDRLSSLADEQAIQVSVHLQADTTRLTTDRRRLEQLLTNLIGNAVKFTEPGGCVDVCLVGTGSLARIDVVDTGPGIAPEDLPHIFDAFRQTDASTTRVHGGTGLGLAIVRQLAAALDLRVEAASVVGSGSTFSVLIDPAEVMGPHRGVAPPAPERRASLAR